MENKTLKERFIESYRSGTIGYYFETYSLRMALFSSLLFLIVYFFIFGWEGITKRINIDLGSFNLPFSLAILLFCLIVYGRLKQASSKKKQEEAKNESK